MDAKPVVMPDLPCGLLLVGLDEHILDANERMARMLGHTVASLRGLSWLSLLPKAARLMHHTCVAPLLSAHGHVDEISLPWLAADGSTVDTLINAGRTTHQGEVATWLAVFQLRERRQLEEELFHAKRVAEQVPGMLFLLRRKADSRWQLLYASEGVRDLFDVSPLQAVADPAVLWRAMHTDDLHAIQEALRTSGDQMRSLRIEYRVWLAGQERWHETHATPQRESDGGLLWHGYTCDITERKAMEAATRDRQAAEQASEAKSAFLARVSHELRTPLNGILGFSKLMLLDTKAPLEPDQRRKARYIEEAGQVLLRLVNEVMDISRIETGHIDLNMVSLALPAVVQDAVRMVEPMAEQHGVRISVKAERQPQVQADSHRLTQVLINLLSNAIKYGPAGGQVAVTVTAHPDEGASVEVADQGPGLSPQQQAELFQPFNRLGAERTGVEGTGLGLIITRGLVELMGGELAVSSVPGEGCRFVVRLPLQPAQAVPTTDQPDRALSGGSPFDHSIPAADAPKEAPAAALQVLYVEDNPINMLLMASVLEQRPACHLLPANSGAAALDVVKQVRPDLLLVDIHLPDTDGVACLETLRSARPDLAGVPAIAVSADALADDIEGALAHGFAAYWTKPLDVAQVLARMDAMLEERGPVGGTMSP
ncbi:MAG: response regulator [Rubrivivax sp.]|nr:MAG: response regulator [Rubrivivax sp.]